LARVAALFVVVLAAAVFAGRATAATFYVNTRGDDAAPGTQAQPWRTLARVNNQQLKPGDVVLLAGNQTFEGPLVPWGSGKKNAQVRFSSYGGGRATIASAVNNIVWFPGNSYLLLDNLRLTSLGADNHIVASNPAATSAFITIRNCVITDGGAFGINSPSLTDHDWTIEKNLVTRTNETGITFRGAGFIVSGNTIVGTGLHPREGAHGVYAKGPAAQVVDNTIIDFAASGITIRYENTVARGNRISGGLIGISQFQDAEVTKGGRSLIAYNTISDVTLAGIYLDGSTLEEFAILNNTIKMTSGWGMNLHEVAALTLANNVVTGKFENFVLVVRKPIRSYAEHHNLWYPSGGAAFGWNRNVMGFTDYAKASGQGKSDLLVDPQLEANLAPKSTSPVLDSGAKVSGFPYRSGCGGGAFRFCDQAPDVGALERKRARKRRRRLTSKLP
jgi:parallel beta helix pectate lyase-like protein